MPNADLDQRMRAVEKLVVLFRLERMVYLVVTCVALLMLLGSAGLIIIHDRNQPGDLIPELGLMFGASGMITYSTGRLLNMFNQAMAVIVYAPKAVARERS